MCNGLKGFYNERDSFCGEGFYLLNKKFFIYQMVGIKEIKMTLRLENIYPVKKSLKYTYMAIVKYYYSRH